MNDYVSRNELSPVDRTVTRAVTAVQSASQTGVDLGPEERRAVAQAKIGSGDGADLASSSEEQLASAAEYARVHARIADIMANLRTSAGADTQSTSSAEQALVSLLPAPIVIVPLPPASKDMVEHAAAVAKQVAEQAALSRSAQARVKPGTVDQILATAA